MIRKYKNGNTYITIDDHDGTKERITYEEEFKVDFAETIDLNISQYCENACEFCYSDCSLNGKHADLLKYKEFLDGLHPHTELAININSHFHPQLIPFLNSMKENKVIVNATINQKDFEIHYSELKELIKEKLLWGLGVSLVNPTQGFIEKVQKFPNAIIHVINGIITPEQIKTLSDKELKLLILGYKQVGRGIDWYSKEAQIIKRRQEWLDRNLHLVVKHFKVVSFDNLAVEQLDTKRLVSEEEWDSRFLGADGTISFYVNLVQGYFAKNSLSDVHYEIGDKTVDECFKIILESNKTG